MNTLKKDYKDIKSLKKIVKKNQQNGHQNHSKRQSMHNPQMTQYSFDINFAKSIYKKDGGFPAVATSKK